MYFMTLCRQKWMHSFSEKCTALHKNNILIADNRVDSVTGAVIHLTFVMVLQPVHLNMCQIFQKGRK